jgi:DNA-binding response OmpR family regulator
VTTIVAIAAFVTCAGLIVSRRTVDVALDGDDAAARLGTNRNDVIILDRDLPVTLADLHSSAASRAGKKGRSSSG